MLARVWKVNVNSRDCRGWTPVAIAVFHEAKKSLRLLLDNGADPNLKNQYNKNAYYFAKDDLDAANNIVKSRAEVSRITIVTALNNLTSALNYQIRQVLIDWENEHRPAAIVPVTASPEEPPPKARKSGPKKPSTKPTKKRMPSTAAPTNASKVSTVIDTKATVKTKKISTKASK
ncbi:hypothetical protein DVH05_020621 [Phytophthora capsici]|nr:hypothetical protein DVH05_020621 [Phytophthora capsici]